MTQQPLWHDVRTPPEYFAHYRKYRKCVNCHMPLQHELHALNHWEKCHTVKQRSTRAKRPTLVKRTAKPSATPYLGYRAWKPGAQQWQVVSEESARKLQRAGFCIARIKRPATDLPLEQAA